MKKISGKEFKDFYFDEKFWPKDDGETYVDDMEILVDGQVFNDVVDISDNSVVSLVNGVVINPLLPDGYCSLKSFFLKWRKQQSQTYFFVSCKKDDFERINEWLKNNDAQILK